MKTILFLLLLLAPAHAESTVIVSDGEGKVVNSWCEANGTRWAEHGSMCHANPLERTPVICASLEEDRVTAFNGFCSIPAGWEKVDMGAGDKPYSR